MLIEHAHAEAAAASARMAASGRDRRQAADGERSGVVDDIVGLTPLVALRLLGTGIEAMVRITGDVPPTPPPTSPPVHSWRDMQREKEHIVRSNSQKSLERLLASAESEDRASSGGDRTDSRGPAKTPSYTFDSCPSPHPIDGVALRAIPDHHHHHYHNHHQHHHRPPRPSVIGANSQPLAVQHGAIARKFYSKSPPPIGIPAYLERLHKFCPSSAAVYLAASLYLHRLAVEERAVAVTARNAHRLALAGLRVAAKALEDLSHPHARMAKVGGVTPEELARLEINFCFLTGFELVVSREALAEHYRALAAGTSVDGLLAEAMPC